MLKEQDQNPHYDHSPRDSQMRAFGWRLGADKVWFMPASEYIARNEQRIIQKYLVNLPEDFVTEEVIESDLSRTLRSCLEIDREIRHE